jgi:hypothetical protein
MPSYKNLSRRPSYLSLLVPPLHVGLMFLAYQLLVLLFGIPQMDLFQLKAWDANWYAGIAERGYTYSATEQSSVAFFPLFPYLWHALWKLTGAGVEGICLFNACAFFAGLFLLRHTFDFSWWYLLFFASIPSNMFMFVPYTEGLYFLFCSVFIAGAKQDNIKLKLAGLFLASLTRPTAFFFFPALVVMELFCNVSLKVALKRVLVQAVAPLLALGIVICVQYADTGVWFAYFRDGWHRQIALPRFPLTTWGGAMTLWLDGLAFLFCMLCLIVLAWHTFQWFGKKGHLQDSPVVFSLAYLVMPGLSALLMGSYDRAGGTTLASLNRYVMATPFFVVVLFYLTHQVTLNYRTAGVLILTVVLTYLLLNFRATGFAEYQAVHRFLYPLFMLFPLLLYVLASRRFNERFLPMAYLVNLFIMVLLLNRFAREIWVG